MPRKPIARLQLRVVFDTSLVIGPGKVDLLEHVRDTGSISAAGRRMKMSYKRAWDLIDAMNRHFVEPVVETSKGGAGGGGAKLTAMGEEVIERYRRIQAQAARAAQAEMKALHGRLRGPATADGTPQDPAAPRDIRS